jgi:predicted protein tyrosine phosphatase
MLFDWADYIVIMEPSFEKYIPEESKNRPDGSRKLFCYDVGPDKYGNPFHPELQAKLLRMIKSHGLFIPTENFQLKNS